MTDVIELAGLGKTYRDKRYRKVEALRDINLAVQQGEAFGFIGPNGAGKSTTIKILTGTIRASSGSARMLGKPVDDYRARQGLGYVPENSYLYDYLTPLEVLIMGAHLQKLKVDNLQKHCMHWLERFGIAHVANRRIRSFSKGMAQRTALAHALVVQPKLLILDEPLSGLDPIGRKEVVDILLDYRRQGGTIFFSSHVLHDVERLADRFGLIHQGTLRTVQQPQDLAGGEGRVVVRSTGSAAVAGMHADTGDRWYIETDNGKLWPLLREIEAAGHRLIEIKPSMTLEQAFLQYVGADNQPAGH